MTRKSKKVIIQNLPLKVKVIPEIKPEPTEEEELIVKLKDDKEQRYNRNVALNPKISQQGLVLGELGMLSGKTNSIKGDGVKEDGMYDNEIEDIMKKYPSFKGVIAADEISSLKVADKIGFIMNTADRNEVGEHWVACLIDTHPNVRSVEFFDPFGKRPTKKFLRDIKMLIDRINPPTMLLHKINRVQQQNITTNTCGLHSINFLIKRLNGKSFLEATGYKPGKKLDQSVKYEKEIDRKFSEYL